MLLKQQTETDHFCVFEDEPLAVLRFCCGEALSLFNTPQYVALQAAGQIVTFVLTDTMGLDAIGVFNLYIIDNKAITPKRGSFGSFELTQNISHSTFTKWLNFIENYLKNKGINTLEIKHFPVCYQPQKAAFIKRGLLRNQFKMQALDSSFLEITSAAFSTKLYPAERRRLRKCTHAGFTFEHWPQPDAAQVFEFISRSRALLHYSLSFTVDELRQWLLVFPENYLVFCVKDGPKIASLALAVKVKDKVLYNFCPADDMAYRPFSPAVALNEGLYRYCQIEGYKILDLGVSIDDKGLPKASLARFKRNLGAKISPKIWFLKQF
jgi:hypothetical protein